MELIPILEIKAGQSVIQTQPKASQQHLFTTDPLKIAKRWQEEGATRLHLVDLDGARVGMPQNRDVIRDLIRRINLPVDLSGGIPNLDVANRMFGIGVDRIVVHHGGTIPDREIIDMLREHTRKIVIEINALDGQWTPPMISVPQPPPPPKPSPSGMGILGAKPYDPLARPPSSPTSQGTAPVAPPPNLSRAPSVTNHETPIWHYVHYIKTMGARTVMVHSVTHNGTSGALHQDLAALGRGAGIPIILRGEVVRRRAIEVLSESGIQGMILGRTLYDGTLTLPDLLTIGHKSP